MKWLCGLIFFLLVYPTLAQDHTVHGIEVDLPSERMQLLQTSGSISTNLITEGICEQVQLLDAGAMLCQAYDYVVALISGGEENITTIAAMRDGEYLGQALGINAPVISLGMFLEEGAYEVLVQETTNDGKADVYSFNFEIDFWQDEEIASVSPTAAPTDLPSNTPKEPATAAGAQDQDSLCLTENAYAVADGPGIQFDLLCKPLYPETIELDSDDSIEVTVNLENYRAYSGDDKVEFRLHFAIERGALEIRQPGSFGAEDLSDSGGNLKDLQFRTTDDVVVVEITNDGFRSAIFDLSVWPD